MRKAAIKERMQRLTDEFERLEMEFSSQNANDMEDIEPVNMRAENNQNQVCF